MPLDPTPANNEHHFDELPDPDAHGPAGPRDPLAESGEEPIRTLLWTAATYRPLEEVAALVMLLKRTGEVPNPGDEALRVAAVARPIDEVMRLVAMLNEPPHEFDEADTTLRAAAVGRPIEEVAQLVSYLGTHENEPPFATAPQNADHRRPAPRAFGRPDEEARPGEPDTRDDRREGPINLVSLADPMAHTSRRPEPEHEPEPEHVAPWMSAPAGPPTEVPRLAPPAGPRDRDRERDRDRSAPSALRSPLRSRLRRPAAVALLACGVIHLPTDFAGLRSGGYADAVSLVVTVLCLMFGAWLAVADTARIWAASAATAVGAIAAHTLSSLGTTDLLQSSLGAEFGWASLAAVGCAGVTLALAGFALMLRQKTTEEAPLRSPAAGSPYDA
ncbi:hypothetical protein [Streptomyces sp. NBC_01716]|uniref:hypothetical protein n=1 Tax=Streptomyces sp. NBC_01716 TaxID=2975917 RepID=UPI002E3141B8|nr:hypothetical protein [Streptomyces sp. NBC_01716]